VHPLTSIHIAPKNKVLILLSSDCASIYYKLQGSISFGLFLTLDIFCYHLSISACCSAMGNTSEFIAMCVDAELVVEFFTEISVCELSHPPRVPSGAEPAGPP